MNELDQTKKILDVSEIDFKEILQHLRAGKKIIFITMGLGLLLSCFFVIFKAPIYQPTVLLQANNQNNSATSGLFANGLGNTAANMGIANITSEASTAQIQMTLMQTSYILQPVINSLALNIKVQPKYLPWIGHYIARQYQGDTPAPAKFWLSSFAWGGEALDVATFNVPPDNFKEKFTLRILDAEHYALYHGWSLVLKGSVNQIATSNNGKISLLVNLMRARPGTEFYLYRYSNVDTLANLQHNLQIDELSPKATTNPGNQDTGLIQLSLKSVSPMVAVNVLNTVANLATQANSKQKNRQNVQLLNFIKQEIPVAQQNLIAAEERLNRYQSANGLIDLNNQSKMLLQDFSFVDSQIIGAELNKAQLLQIYTPANPMILNAQSGIDALNQQKAKLNTLLANLPVKYQTVIDLMRDVKVYNMLYTQLLMKAQQMQITNAGLGSDLTILDLATPPDQALPSYAFLTIFVGTLLGAFIGGLIILIRHALTGGINDPYFVERELGIRTIAIVPYSPIQAKNKKLFDQGKIKSLPILTKIDNQDPAIESLRSLRTALSLMLAKKTGKCVTISGIIPQIGKSFVSVNLAAVLAESGKKVLLVDGDIRKGYLHQYFKKPIAPGLSELLSGITTLDKVIHKTEFTNLEFISCGLHAQNPGDLLLREEVPQLLGELEKYYDLIIIDTPPMLAVSDASLIAKYCAFNFIVIAAGKLQKHEVETAVKQFYAHSVQLDGNIFNFTNKNIQAASKFSYQHYYTRYYRKT
jgi:tyrosine-protein kinase Etk/Wzc